MSWNVVLNKFVEIKQKFIDTFGKDELWKYKEGDMFSNCIDYWVAKLNIPEYISLTQPLQINEYNDMVLIRYGRFSDVFGGESEYEFADFWDMYDGFYMECRSVVINIVDNELVLTPFRKFRNINECEENSEANVAKRIRKAKCVEFTNKLDGSMQSARWYRNHLVMSGSQALDASASFRLEDGYTMVSKDANCIEMLKKYPNYTAIFEYISLKDAHVVHYTKEQEGMYLIGMRNVNTGVELPYSDVIAIANAYNLRTTEAYNKTLNEVMSSLDEKKSDEAEGFVLNIDGYKVKIKYNDYVNMHGILSAMSSINLIIHSIADDNWDDFLAKVPDAYKDRAYEVSNKVFEFVRKKELIVNEWYQKLLANNYETRKDSMIWIDANVPKSLRGYVRAKYLGMECNYLKNGNGRYIMMKEIDAFLK